MVTREHLVDAVLSRKFSPFDRSIDMHVSKVRKKLGDSDNGSDHIKTVRGVGYIFAHPRDHAKSQAAKARKHEKPVSQDISLLLDGAGAFLVLAIMVTLAMRPSREISNLQAQEPKFLNEAVQAYQSGGDEAARKYFRTIRDNQHVRHLHLRRPWPRTVGTQPPPWIERARHGRIHTADTFLGRFGPGQVLSQTLTADNGRNYTLIIDLPPEEQPFFGPHGIHGVGLLIAIISSGLVCYILARYLTSPIVQLRGATQKLASGDLTARAGMPGISAAR